MQKQILIFIYFLGLLLLPQLFPTYLFSQNNTFQKITKEDGLPSNSVYGVTEDSKGYIWIFTEKGVSKYDGYEFKNFGLQDGLVALDVWDLTIDQQDRIWLHSLKGLVYIEEDSVHKIWTESVEDIGFKTIFEDSLNIWVNNYNNRFLLENDSLLVIKDDKNFDEIAHLQKSDSCIICYPNINLNAICFNEYSLTEVNQQGEEVSKYAFKEHWLKLLLYLNNRKIDAKIGIHKTDDGFILMTPLGIGKWFTKEKKGKSFSFKSQFNLPFDKNRMVRCKPGFNGNLQMMLDLGFMFEIDAALNVVDSFDYQVGKSLHRIYKDREGNIWISTGNEGILFLPTNAKKTKVFSEPTDERILSLTGDFDGNIFYGTDNGGVFRFKNGKSHRLIAPSKIGVDVNGVLLNPRGELFFGAERDVFYIDTQKSFANWEVKSLNDEFNIIPSAVTSMKIADSLIIVTTTSGKLHIAIPVKDFGWNEEKKELWSSNGRSLYQINFSDSQNIILDIIEIERAKSLVFRKDGALWAGTINGLRLVENDSVIDHNYSNALLQHNVIAMAMDAKEILWVGTEGNGVYGVQADTVYPIKETEGDFILSVFIDYENKLWVGTDNGVKQFDLDPNEIGKTQLIKTYTLADGLLSSEVNAIMVDSHYIYLGTNNGLVQIEKPDNQNGVIKPLIYLEHLKIKGKSFQLDTLYELTYDQNELEFFFTGLSYQSFGKLTYQYQLDNVDNGWQTTTNRHVRYPKLAPGNYTFKLKTIDVYGTETALGRDIHFIIHPPYWATTWFKLLMTSTFFGILWLIYKLRLQRIMTKEAEQTAINKKFAELELQALQSQMNPHFVFNALASIQYFIQENNEAEAEDYLAKFAKLMRGFLESSKTKYTSLSEELKMVNLYIEMEQMRFEKRFDIAVQVTPELDTFSIKIPTMILQPFIENAIHHGLFHKKEKGILRVTYDLSEDETQLICLIEDNGIGRSAAAEIKQNSLKGYKSRGMQIVEERLEVLRNIENYDIQINIEDLFDTFGESAGTKVIITIPIND